MMTFNFNGSLPIYFFVHITSLLENMGYRNYLGWYWFINSDSETQAVMWDSLSSLALLSAPCISPSLGTEFAWISSQLISICRGCCGLMPLPLWPQAKHCTHGQSQPPVSVFVWTGKSIQWQRRWHRERGEMSSLLCLQQRPSLKFKTWKAHDFGRIGEWRLLRNCRDIIL